MVGNSVLHVMAYYGLYNDTFQYIVKRNKADMEHDKSKPHLMIQENHDGYTPSQLGLHFGHFSMIDSLKELQWTFGSEMCQYQVPIDEICPILHKFVESNAVMNA